MQIKELEIEDYLGLAAVTSLVAIVTYMGISNFTKEAVIEKTFNDLFDDSLHSLVEDKVSLYDNIREVEDLDNYLYVSKGLSEIDFEKIMGKYEVENDSILLDSSELRNKYDKLKSLIDEHHINGNIVSLNDDVMELWPLLKEMKGQESLINSYVNNNGYSIMNDCSSYFLSSYLDKDIDDSYLSKIYKDIVDYGDDCDSTKYDSDKVELLSSSINHIKVASQLDFNTRDNVVTNSEVKDIKVLKK